MMKCEIPEDLMERVKKFEHLLQQQERLLYAFKWQNYEPLWKEKEQCFNFGEFEMKDQDVTVIMKIFEDGHIYLEASGEKNGWFLKEQDYKKMYEILWLSDSCYFASPGIEFIDRNQKEMFLNMSYCTGRIQDEFCDAGDFAMIAEETMMEFLNDVNVIHTEFFRLENEVTDET